MAYVYRHIRKDINQPFYIGISLSKNNHNRAHEKAKRNPYWKNIVAQTDYDIQILFDSVSNDFAIAKEIELIALYKRIQDGGSLCNMTLGGEGTKGRKPRNAKRVYGRRWDGIVFEFESMTEAEKKTGCSCIGYLIKNKSLTFSGWFFSNTKSGLNSKPRKSMTGKHGAHFKKSITITNGTDVISFESYTSAANHLGVFPNHIGDLVRGKLKSAKGWTLYK